MILESILHAEGESTRGPISSSEVPKDIERGLPLLEIHRPRRDFGDVVLSRDVRDVLQQTLLEQRRRDLLGSYGLTPIHRLLFFGPPGCGKTVTAEVLAGELGLRWVRIRFDGVVSIYEKYLSFWRTVATSHCLTKWMHWLKSGMIPASMVS